MNNRSFFLRMAWTNLGKNRRLFVPQMITAGGLTAVFYIIFALSVDKRLSESRGGAYLPVFMQIGLMVTIILSAILMLYTNSFIIKQRKREFGLYMVLGMEKRHIARVQLWETMITALISVAGGLVCGILLYKLCALFICKLLHISSELASYQFALPVVLVTAGFFLALYLVMAVINRITLWRSSPRELLASVQAGEREPKIKWICLVLGLAAIGGGYGIALTTESVLKAISMFFLAVLLVVIGTYFLFVSGSIAVLKAMRKNKKFYYHPRRMTSISGMLYRMKQNAVGLASICILSTCVIVMLSSTVSLCFGTETALNEMYPDDLYVSATYVDENGNRVSVDDETLEGWIREAAEENHVDIRRVTVQNYLIVSYLMNGTELSMDRNSMTYEGDLSKLATCCFMTAQEYENLTGVPVALKDGETAVYSSGRNTAALPAEFTLAGENYIVSQTLDAFPISMYEYGIANCYGVIVKDGEALERICESQREAYGASASDMSECLAVDYETTTESPEDAFVDAPRSVKEQIEQESTDGYMYRWSSRADTRDSLYGMYGTFFFLGIILGLVFLFATALIIYYKQISEGYEDRQRFQIMRKVGMSDKEIRRTVRTQILMVFFLPLAVAAVHVAVAFPIVCKLLYILFLPNTRLFAGCTVATFAVFAAVYTLIYTLTANTYYKIVR